MDEQIGRLVGNLLASGREVFLPGVGSLYTERQGARRLSKRWVQPPRRAVSFSSHERGTSLEASIARAASCDADTARQAYGRWLSRALVDGTLTVIGVGTLRDKHFTPTPEFSARLNPQGEEPVRIKPARRFDWVLWTGIAAIVGVVGFVAFWWMNDRSFSLNPDRRPTVAQTAGALQTSAESAVQPTHTEAETALTRPQPASEQQPAASQPQPAVSRDDSAANAGQATRPEDSAHASGTPEATRPDPSANANETSGAPASLVSGRKYVVFGVFSSPANAARAAESVAAKNGALRCGIYRFGNKLLVSPFESDDAQACTLFIRAHAGEFSDLWIYTAR